MTINEFRAWLEGFKEAIGEAPTPDQWAKVLAKVSEVREPVDLRPFLRPNEVTRTYEVPNVPFGPAVTCGGTSAGLPGWLKGATLSNMAPLDATASAAIFSDIETLYEN